MICRECQAQFEDDLPRCPYCGMINELGAERKYMREMEDLKDDLKELGHIPGKTIEKEVRSNFSVVAVVAGVMIVLAVVVVLIVAVAGKLQEKQYETSPEQLRAQMAWEDETFPYLDQLYEEGGLDAVCEYEESLADEKCPYNLYGWEHYGLLEVYRQYLYCKEFQEAVQTGETVKEYEIEGALFDYMSLRYLMENNWRGLSEEDYAIARDYQEKLSDFREKGLLVTEEEADQIYEELTKDGYLAYKPCKKQADRIKNRFNLKK